jgi:phosphoribosylaminoimidazole-succinocarboxamide synthase
MDYEKNEDDDMTTIRETELPNPIYSGKVRDTYDLGGGQLLMVATDRISAFDVVLPTGIPEKGAVLSQMSAYWFGKTADIVPNHLVALGNDRPDLSIPPELARRAMVVRRAERIDIECVVRGYITGSAWAEYRAGGMVAGIPMPSGMKEGDTFPAPLFTPSTKAEEGHDENITVRQMEDLVGVELTAKLAEISVAIYSFARDLALEKGIIIADTKMEYGIIDGEVTLIDELLTPDSSRFWDTDGYEPGKSQPNFDKQFVRDWLNAQNWDHEPPAPELPEDVVENTRRRYVEAFERLTGRKLT